jgi:putative ABC transport system permease protein
VLGIVNTLALSVIERTRELGLLRAVGLQRRQLRRMIRVESVVIAVYGALLGLAVGVAFGWAMVRALHGQGVTEFSLPYGRLVQVLVVAALAGVLAAALPARRAARLNVLEAVAST